MVHITNGDAVADKLRRWAGEPRLIIWHDVLHEGPVPPGKSLEEFTAIRSRFLHETYGGDTKKLEERDRQLRRLVSRDSIWMWFEDDLYDQLQLLQLLHFLREEGLTQSPHFLVEIPRNLDVEEMASLAANKKRLTPLMLETGARAWEAFTRGEIPALLETDLDALSHLRPALLRLLDHDRVERTILELLKDGGKTAEQLFTEYQKTEERPFLGDTSFYRRLAAMAPRVQKDAHSFYQLSPGAWLPE